MIMRLVVVRLWVPGIGGCQNLFTSSIGLALLHPTRLTSPTPQQQALTIHHSSSTSSCGTFSCDMGALENACARLSLKRDRKVSRSQLAPFLSRISSLSL